MRNRNCKNWVMAVFVLAAANIASATIIRGIDIDFVTIGNAGNPADGSGYGAVGYEYRIGKYEITNGQWDSFVAAAGAPTGNDGGYYESHWTGDNIPTNRVNWYEAAQFCNYLTSGDKSKGAYQFSGDNSNPGYFEGIDRDSAVSTYGIAYVIPTEDEWYKAASYTGSGYSAWANGTDTKPIAGVESNYGREIIGRPWDVGSGTIEQNGTYDMMGNVWEWNEGVIVDIFPCRCQRGGSYDIEYFYQDYFIAPSYRGKYDPPFKERMDVGFRVASIPEPATFLLLGLGVVMARRKKG